MVLPVSTPLYILYGRPPKTFASEVEAVDAALRCKSSLYLLTPEPHGWAWFAVAAYGALERGGPRRVDAGYLPLDLWLMGNRHIRSGQ
jgi:hypothetical protein